MAVGPEADLAQLKAAIPLFEDERAIGGRTTVYVCQERVRKLPASEPSKVAALLRTPTH